MKTLEKEFRKMNNERYNQVIDEAYENYKKHIKIQRDIQMKEVERLLSQGKRVKVARINLLTKEEFINKYKTDSEFSQEFGLKIEERELSSEERKQIVKNKYFIEFYWKIVDDNNDETTTFEMDKRNIPTKLITIIYNNETIEVYE
jgi:hypothetical protein